MMSKELKAKIMNEKSATPCQGDIPSGDQYVSMRPLDSIQPFCESTRLSELTVAELRRIIREETRWLEK